MVNVLKYRSASVLFFLIVLFASCSQESLNGVRFPQDCFERQSGIIELSEDWYADQEDTAFTVFLPNGYVLESEGLHISSPTGLVEKVLSWTIVDVNEEVVFELVDFDIDGPDNFWDGKVDGEYTEGVYSYTVKFVSPTGIENSITFTFCAMSCDNFSEHFDDGANINEARFPSHDINEDLDLQFVSNRRVDLLQCN